ncbi:tyrosine-type recombinase/integrase [Gordonia sputi]
MSSVHPYTTDTGRKWRVRWRDELGKSRQKKGFGTKREAQLWKADLDVKTARGEWVDPGLGKQTLGAVGERWLTQQAHLKPTTRHNLRLWYARHVEPKWSGRAVGSVKPSEVRAWVTDLATAEVGVPTIERAVGILRQLFDLAVEDGLIVASPAANVRVPKRQPSDRAFLTHEQVEALADEVGERYRLVIELISYTGLRWGELAALQVQDCDMLRRRLHVRRGVTEVKGKLHFSTTKTGRGRIVPFPDGLAEPLARRMEGKERDELVFSTETGAVLRNTTFRPRVFNPAVKRCQAVDPTFPKVTIHDLRHTAATLAIAAGATVKGVQQMLGHQSASLTLDTYAGFFEDDLGTVAERLEQKREAARRGHGEATASGASVGLRGTS